MKAKHYTIALAIMALAIGPADAAAYQAGGAHVTLVEGTYSPSDVRFRVDVAAGACPAGSYLFFHPKGQNDAQQVASASAVMASLLTAKATNTLISFGGDDNGCNVSYVVNVG